MLTMQLTMGALAVGLSTALISPASLGREPSESQTSRRVAAAVPASVQLSYRLQLDGRDSTG